MLKFFEFCAEREAIRLRREAGQPFPWTDNEILRDYRFTNINRKHDKGTVALIKAINDSPPEARPSFQHIYHFVNVYRFLGSPLWVVDLANLAPLDRNKCIQERWHSGLSVMKMSAYQINVPAGMSPIDLACSLWPTLPDKITKLQEGCGCTGMLAVRAVVAQYTKDIGYNACYFHGMEIAKDLSLLFPSKFDPQSEVALGPGAIKGIEHALDGVCEDIYDLQLRSIAINMPMTMSTLEHALCEYGKYVEAFNGTSSRRYVYAK